MTLDEARALDAADPLAGFRDRFVICDADLIYLDGNSLGRMPKAAADVVDRLQVEWGERLVRGWGEGWYGLPQRLGAKIAKLIGARDDEVIVCDSTSVNLYKLTEAALNLAAKSGRRWVLSDETNFPSDLFILKGDKRPSRFIVNGLRPGLDDCVSVDQYLKAMDASSTSIAMIGVSHVAFKSGHIHPMQWLTEEARARGIMALWDLSHSVGVLPVDLCRSGVDLAVGCTYKYLSGGPGSPAFLYVRRDLQEKLESPIRGWFGQRDPFQFSTEYHPAAGVTRFLAGTPPILSMATAEPGIDLVLEAGVDAIRRKSVAQAEFLIRLFDEHLASLGFKLGSPRDSAVRGSHVSFSHPLALQIDQALIHEMNVVPDFRTPDNLRLGVAPLYTRFVDLHEAIMRIKRVMEEKVYERYSPKGIEVT